MRGSLGQTDLSRRLPKIRTRVDIGDVIFALSVTLWHAQALPPQLLRASRNLVGRHNPDDSRIRWWLRQNITLFASKGLVACNERLSATSSVYIRPISIVHPDIYLTRLQALQSQIHRFQQIAAFLGSRGIFRARVTRDGRVDVTKIAEKRVAV
jgi:hypothetical protein